jgi:hypothetical protein
LWRGHVGTRGRPVNAGPTDPQMRLLSQAISEANSGVGADVHSNSQKSVPPCCRNWNSIRGGEFPAGRHFDRGNCEEVVMGRADRLPSRFPDGTRFVIEGRAGHIVSRYLEFPDGRHVELPVCPTAAEQAGSETWTSRSPPVPRGARLTRRRKSAYSRN